MRQFWVAGNHFSGELPVSIGNWTAISYFDISDNNFTGPLPSSLGSWGDVGNFLVFLNSITGSLPEEIGMWQSLSWFDVSILPTCFCCLRGKVGLVSQLFDASVSCSFQTIKVSQNKLSGTLPASIGQWTEIDTFLVSKEVPRLCQNRDSADATGCAFH